MIRGISTEAGPTDEGIRRLAARLVSDELVVVPVRHHSPACSVAVQQAFDRHRPSRVLIEGPRSFTGLIPLLSHPEAEFPLAVYAWSRPAGRPTAAAERHGGYYPLCDYSPELVAARLAHAAGIPVAFCDLEVGEQAAAGSAGALPGDGSLLQERTLTHSRALAALAERMGCRDEEDLWELLFEADPAEVELAEHLSRMTAYCLLARRDHTDEELQREGTTAREAEMAWHVREALSARTVDAGPVLVVLGGFHAVALPDLLAAAAPRPSLDRGAVDDGAALIRYSFERLDRLNGYASGMTSPGWHQLIWDGRRAGAAPAQARAAAVLGTLLGVAEQLRHRHHLPVPTPSLAAAQGQAVLLAELRDRPAPLRSDLLDAVTSCLIQGEADVEGLLVRTVTRAVLTGFRVGRVPPGAGTPPLVQDALQQLRALRLDTEAAEPRNLALDIYRNPGHRRTSRVLHGLRLLGVPFATHVAGPDFVHGTGLTRLQERWTYLWSPATEGRLAEVSLLGSTLPEAVRSRYRERLDELTAGGRVPTSAEAASLFAQAAVVGLHEETGDVIRLVRDALAAETSFLVAARATGALALLAEGREPLEAGRLTRLPDLVAAGYVRCLYLGAQLRGEEEPAEEVATSLSRLRELLASPAGAALDPELFWQLVDRLRREHGSTLVRGAAAGLAATAGRLDANGLARDVAGHLAGSLTALESVGFVRGLLATARESVWQASGLMAALDARFSEWEQATFLAALPELRLAFANLTPRETDRVAETVAGLHDGARPDVMVRHDVDARTVQRHAELSHRLSEVLRRDGLSAWVAGEP